MAGRIQILVYLRHESPGSIWARSAQPGFLTHIIGPQQSLDLIGPSQPAVFFGDETSFAAAKTLQSNLAPSKTMGLVFETSSDGEAQSVIDRLELRGVQLYKRQADDGHIPVVAEAIQHVLANVATPRLVLTGNGRSIQALRANLRTRHSGLIDYRVKAYWAPGKTGLE